MKTKKNLLALVLSAATLNVHAMDITQNHFGYTSQYSNMYGGFRQYDANNARFVQADTFTSFTKKPVSNTYAYVKGNPVLFEDPSGHMLGRFLRRITGEDPKETKTGKVDEFSVNTDYVDKPPGSADVAGSVKSTSSDDKKPDGAAGSASDKKHPITVSDKFRKERDRYLWGKNPVGASPKQKPKPKPKTRDSSLDMVGANVARLQHNPMGEVSGKQVSERGLDEFKLNQNSHMHGISF